MFENEPCSCCPYGYEAIDSIGHDYWQCSLDDNPNNHDNAQCCIEDEEVDRI